MAGLSRLVNLLAKAGVGNSVIKWILVAVAALTIVWGGLDLAFHDDAWFQKMNPFFEQMGQDLDNLEQGQN